MPIQNSILREAEKELCEEINALLKIWSKRDRSNPDCWRRKYLPKVKKLESVRIAINEVLRKEHEYYGEKFYG